MANTQRQEGEQQHGNPTWEFRAIPMGYELRDEDGAGMPTLVGHLAVFNEWTEINSRTEGHFMERIAPGAFKKTLSENLTRMRCLFQHGKDPTIGEKPLGPIRAVTETDRGVEYEVPLFDTSYNRDLVEMLRADPPVLGSSFRFAMVREDNVQGKKSAQNPRGLRERTVTELRMSEFGPVTFPAYAGTGARLRSITDRMLGLEEERVDVEDMSCLAQMIQLGTCYIGEQDETDDAGNIPAMNSVLESLAGLMSVEAAENEPMDEPEDEDGAEMASEDGRSEGTVILCRTSANNAGTTHLGRGRREGTLYLQKREERRAWELP